MVEIVNIKNVTKKEVLVRNNVMKMIGFVFEKGEGLPKHTHNGMAIIQIVEGIVNISFADGNAEILKTGDIMQFDARIEHNLIADILSRVIVTIII